jgi:2-polyprenyl-6-hydroxyphenyl methylase/3-demethylubiquinone-9 3-methyltransferase
VSEPDLASSERTAFFDALASGWSSTQYGPQGSLVPRIARFADALQHLAPPSARILDHGCGTGDIAAALAARGFRVDARDASPKMIEQARALHAGSAVRFAVIEPTLGPSDAGADREAFDAVVCSSVLEYVDDLPAGLRQLVAMLKPGGWLLATVPDIDHPARRHEPMQRRLMRSGAFRALIRRTRWGTGFEMQWLSRNRLPIVEWAALLDAAQLRPVWRDCADHPLTMLVGQKSR